MPSETTKERVLDAAERLFAEQGYAGTSLRAVTGAADVNLAAVNYHFGGKLKLFKAVFERRVGDINRERLRLLGEAEAAAGTAGPDLDTILQALFGPVLRMYQANDEGYARFGQLVGRAHSAAGEHVLAIQGVFQEVQDRFFPAFLRALPHLQPADLIWRVHFLIGSMCTHLADPTRLRVASGGLCASDDPEEALRQIVVFAAGSLRAPSSPSQTSS